MLGFDQDDAGIFRRFLDEACVDVATVSMVVPMPGTPTYRRLSAEGRILTTDWSRYDGKKHCVFEPAQMSPAELQAGTEWVARRFYSPRSIVRRLAGSRAGIWWNLPRNVGYMLAGLSNAGPSWDPAGQRADEPGPDARPLNEALARSRTVIEAELVEYLGPMARVVVDEHVQTATNLTDLIDSLAGELSDPGKSARFKERVRERLASSVSSKR